MNVSISAESHPNHKRVFKLIVTGSLTMALVGAAAFRNQQGGWPFHSKPKTAESDNVRMLRDGDSIPQKSKSVKVPIAHYSPGKQPVVEVVDTIYGHFFYAPAVVKDGYAYFQLNAGNPQDAGRVFKVRGLLMAGDVKIPFGDDLEKPLTGDELFPQMLFQRE
jgi:hypothetical protein